MPRRLRAPGPAARCSAAEPGGAALRHAEFSQAGTRRRRVRTGAEPERVGDRVDRAVADRHRHAVRDRGPDRCPEAEALGRLGRQPLIAQRRAVRRRLADAGVQARRRGDGAGDPGRARAQRPADRAEPERGRGLHARLRRGLALTEARGYAPPLGDAECERRVLRVAAEPDGDARPERRRGAALDAVGRL